MRGSTILILGTLVLSLVAPSHATARPKFGPAAVLGAVTAPLGAMLGGVRPSFVQHGRSPTRPSERSDDDARAQLRPGATVSSERTAAVFWPDAPADLVAYVFFPKGKDERFWAFGYGTIIDAAFADGTDPRGRGRRIFNRESSAAPPAMLANSSGRAELCGNSSAAGDADALTDRIEHAIRPSAVQRDVLKQLCTRAGDRTDQFHLFPRHPCDAHRTAQGDPGSDLGDARRASHHSPTAREIL